MRWPRSGPPWVLGAALVMTALALVVTWDFPTRGVFTKYWFAAGELLAGRLAAERLGDVSPGYLAVVAAARWLGLSTVACVRLQVALLGAGAALVGLTAARLGGAVAGAAAVVLVLASRTALVNASDLEPETVLLVLLAAALWCVVREPGRPGWLLAGGLTVGLAVAVRPTALAAIGGLALGLWLAGGPRRMATFLAGALAPVVVAAASFHALTGTLSVMDGGAVFLEGNGAMANGYTGVQPAIVNDLVPLTGVPDGIHITYRQVVSRAVGREVDRDEANGYWRSLAVAFMRAHPDVALQRFAEKALFAVHDYDAWDTLPMETHGRSLRWAPGFALLTGLAALGAVALKGRLRWLVVLAGLALLSSPVLMYVTGRQRNPLVPVLAVLGGVAVGRGVSLVRHAPRRVVAASLGLAAWLAVMTTELHWMTEDRLAWQALGRAEQLLRAASHEPPGARRTELLAEAATWNTGAIIDAEPGAVRAAAQRVVTSFDDPAAWFDAALALLRAGDAAGAEAVLKELDRAGYAPMRGPRAVSSVAYHRAVAVLAQGRAAEADSLLARARADAPGDPDVLALSAVRAAHGGDATAAASFTARLEAFHDPFTAELAMASALKLAGDPGWSARLAHLKAVFPEWTRPARALAGR